LPTFPVRKAGRFLVSSGAGVSVSIGQPVEYASRAAKIAPKALGARA
jgi:hypothetical protein